MSRRDRRKVGKINICQHGRIYVDNNVIPSPKLEYRDVWVVPVATRKMFEHDWYAGLLYIPCIHRFAHMVLSYQEDSEMSTFWLTKCTNQLVKIRCAMICEDINFFGMVAHTASPTIVFLSAQDYPGHIPECEKIKKEFLEKEIVNE